MEAVAADVGPPADSRLQPALAADMAKHGLTEADQLRLFGEGVTSVDGFGRLSDANVLQSGVDIAARRRTKQQRDEREPRFRQAQALLDGAGLSAPARDAVRHVASLRRIDVHARTELGLGLMDRATLLKKQEAWRSLAMPVVPTEPERRAERTLRVSALLLLCGVAVAQCGWWSLYGDLGLWCGLIGGAMALAGAVCFDCAPPHIWRFSHPLSGAWPPASRQGGASQPF